MVNGSKLYITNALGCDFGILFARVVDEDGTDHGVTGLLVDAAESRFGVHDIPHMPLRSTTSCELTFDDTFVPAGNVLGKLGGGLSLGMAAVNAGRLNMAMGAVGLSQACLEESIRFCRQREQFGKPIAGFQLVQQMVVEIATLTRDVPAARLPRRRTIDAGEPGRYECSMAKYYCGESAGRAATLALQLHGGAGLDGGVAGRAVLPRRPRGHHPRGDQPDPDPAPRQGAARPLGPALSGGHLPPFGDLIILVKQIDSSPPTGSPTAMSSAAGPSAAPETTSWSAAKTGS